MATLLRGFSASTPLGTGPASGVKLSVEVDPSEVGHGKEVRQEQENGGEAMKERRPPQSDELARIFAPLGHAEERRAIEAARARLGRRRLHIYGVELRAEKPERGLPPRRITVLAADVADYLPFEVVVDADGAVAEANERPDLVPPFSEREIEEAKTLARSHPDIQELADEWGVALAVFYPTAHSGGEHRPGGRRVGVHLLDTRDEATTALASVVVNLTRRQVESIERHGQSA